MKLIRLLFLFVAVAMKGQVTNASESRILMDTFVRTTADHEDNAFNDIALAVYYGLIRSKKQ